MQRFFRLITISAGALALAGQVGCALTPGSAGTGNQPVTAATGTDLATASADGFFHQYSNTFVAETKYGQPAGLFVYADYPERGGFPVYYPYPYTLPVFPYAYLWSGGYGYRPRSYGPYGSYYASAGGSVTAPVAMADRGVGGVAGNPASRGAGTRANSGAVSRAGDGSGGYRPADNNQQEQSGEIMSSKGIGQTPSPYAAAQYRNHRGSQSSGDGYTRSDQQSSGAGARARQRSVGGSSRGSVRPGLRWSSQRP